jgi:Ca2+:H+ antiporter
VARRLLWASLALAPITFLAQRVFDVGETTLFVLAAIALIPLAWLIGESTEHAAEHTGAGVGGFLNASFGNAPELIIATFAIADGLPDVVRGSITGSVVSNILLVFGLAIVVGGKGELDRRSLWAQLGIVFLTAVILLVPSIPSWDGNPERHSLAVLSIPVAILLLAIYLWVTVRNLRAHRMAHTTAAAEGSWSLKLSLFVLGLATVVTVFMAEALVHSLEHFADTAGLSEFFISAVIVAIVGNAAEHGGAVVIARRGKMKLASEIAISSSAQVAVFVAPAVALLSWIVQPELPLGFRPIELATMAGAAAFVAIVIRDGRTKRWEGFMLLAVYAAVVVAYGVAGDR